MRDRQAAGGTRPNRDRFFGAAIDGLRKSNPVGPGRYDVGC
jgi:hypothetical protein